MEDEKEELLSLQTLRRRARDLMDAHTNAKDSFQDSASELKNLLQDSKLQTELNQVGLSNFNSLPAQHLDAYIADAMEQLKLAQAEEAKIHDELKALTSTYSKDCVQLESDLEGLNCLLKFIELQGLGKVGPGASVDCSTSSNGCLFNQLENYNFGLLDLDHQIEEKQVILSALQDHDDFLKRVEAVGQIEDLFTGLKVLEFDGNGIRFSLETIIPTLSDLGCQLNVEVTNTQATVIHELFVEVYDGTLELRNVEIFPNDVFIGEIFNDAKSSWKFYPSLPLQGFTSSLEWLLQKVQDRIFLCTIRRSVMKVLNSSRHSFEYSDREGTVIAHIASGIDAVIKLPCHWPLVNSTLKLFSLKGPNNSTKEFSSRSWNFEEFGSSLDVQTQQNLSSFVDAIEKAVAQRL